MDDQIDLQRQKRKTIALAVIIGFIVSFSVIYYLWGNLINRGTVLISGEAPFEVLVFGGEKFQCEKNPCEIDQKIGEKQLIITKEGYEDMLIEVDFELWKTLEVEIDLEIIAASEKTDKYPEQDDKYKYRLIYDVENQIQKLIKVGDYNEEGLVFFPKEIKSPKIIGSRNSVLIIEKERGHFAAYRVDLKSKTKSAIAENSLINIDNGKWSENGKYLVFNYKNTGGLWMLDEENKIYELNISANVDQVAWQYEGDLIFTTNQDSETGEVSDFGYRFGKYNPDKKEYTPINNDTKIYIKPTDIVPLSNGKQIFFKQEDEYHKLDID